MEVKRFKGWVIPGPEVNQAAPLLGGDQGIVDELSGEPLTLDSLSGHTKIFQLKNGHRFSTDDVLVAWYGTSFGVRADRVLDLGSGIGSVALMTAWRLPRVQVVTLEAQSVSVRLARRSIQFNQMEYRFEVFKGDLRNPEALKDRSFELITGSPPYFPLDSGIQATHEQKVACRFEVRGTVADYCSTAAQYLAPGGMFAFVFPVDPMDQKQRALVGIQESGLTLIRYRPVALKEGARPLLGLFLCMRSTDLPESVRITYFEEPTLTIRDARGQVTLEYRAIKLSMGFPP
jgi:tRNA1Val (adenine37-N6)-methyltransferase